MKLVVSGSLAYDRIMDFPGHFSDHILPEKIHVLNVCFQVNGIKEKFGGTAGNIAYALRLLGEHPFISATIGHDYHRYLEWLKVNGIPIEGIRVIEDEFTAGAYITTDKSDNQITGFNPGAMKHSSRLDFDALDPKDTLLIVSPGNLEDMIKYPLECKRRGIRYIFDPGQSLPMLAPSDLVNVIDGSAITICNDYELDLIMSKTGKTRVQILKMAQSVIVTLGEKGSMVCTSGGEHQIPVAKTRQVLDPTGAGDSYRGGLLCGLVRGRDILHCARLASVCSSFSVECYGTQTYTFTQEEFSKRLKELTPTALLSPRQTY
ncbi:MAG: carbohydrate kinase family protein [Myxococcota bacterium]|jgi:adenosine kinase